MNLELKFYNSPYNPTPPFPRFADPQPGDWIPDGGKRRGCDRDPRVQEVRKPTENCKKKQIENCKTYRHSGVPEVRNQTESSKIYRHSGVLEVRNQTENCKTYRHSGVYDT